MSEKDLATLSALIYSDYFIGLQDANKNMTLGDAAILMLSNPSWWDDSRIRGDFAHLGGAEGIARYKEILQLAIQSPNLRNLVMVDSTLRRHGDPVGISAAAFRDSNGNTIVVFRGTDGSFVNWNENANKAGIDNELETRRRAEEFMRRLERNGYGNFIVTGHSAGGNLAKYVTLIIRDVISCVAFNAPGFSDDFIEKRRDLIEKNRHKITRIDTYNDFVSIALNCIAGRRIWVENNEYPHYITGFLMPPNAFDENGNFISTREQCPKMKVLGELLNGFLGILPPGIEEKLVNFIGPILGFLFGNGDMTTGQLMEGVINTVVLIIGAIIVISIIVANIKAIVVAIIIAVCVYLVYQAISWAVEQIINAIRAVVDKIQELISNIGEWVVGFMNSVRDVINNFVQRIRDAWNRLGNDYAAANPYIKVNTGLLRVYANRINNVNNRIRNVDRAMNRLWLDVRLRDIPKLIAADIMTMQSPTLNRVRDYLNNAADSFEQAERNINIIMGG